MQILKNLIATILSIILVIALIVLPLLSFGANFLKKDSVESLIDELDIKSELIDNIKVNGNSSPEFTQKIIDSDFFDEVFELSKDYILAPIYDESVRLNEDKLLDITDEHLDELVKIAKTTLSEYSETPNEELRETVRDAFQTVSTDLVKETQDARRDIDFDDITEVTDILPTIHITAIIVILIISGLIFLLTFKRFNGFIWLGTDFGIAAILTFLTTGIFSELMRKFFSDVGRNNITNAIKHFTTDQLESAFNTNLIIYIAVAVVFIILAVVLKLTWKKKKGDDLPKPEQNNATQGQYQYTPQEQNVQPSQQQNITNQNG